jgi:hypothetical protein
MIKREGGVKRPPLFLYYIPRIPFGMILWKDCIEMLFNI